MKNKLKIIIVLFGAICALRMLPLTTTVIQSIESGYDFTVPFLSSYKEESANSITFESIRSAYALQKDLNNSLASYKPMTCKQVKYYYDKTQDITINEAHVVNNILLNEIVFNYQLGNPCLGWSDDQEVKYPYGESSAMSNMLDIDDMIDEHYFVITEEENYNFNAYSDFLMNINNGILGYLRIVNFTDAGTQIIDLQYTSKGVVEVTIDNTRVSASDKDIETHTYDRVATVDIESGYWIVAFDGNDSTVDDRVMLVKFAEK